MVQITNKKKDNRSEWLEFLFFEYLSIEKTWSSFVDIYLKVKGCVKLLKEQPAARSEGLLNALRYTTKHLNEEATPKNIKNLLAA
uniref:CYRIA/CYRIB Rac1 binding domain-containing protein n=1 Tax=Timema cristinae TaxID=61476 RepID=A0A7R9D3X9_TIMCR|nr:unnamed protein product [Timema cristinae]